MYDVTVNSYSYLNNTQDIAKYPWLYTQSKISDLCDYDAGNKAVWDVFGILVVHQCFRETVLIFQTVSYFQSIKFAHKCFVETVEQFSVTY